MSNFPTRTEQCAKEEYNNIPVHYCRNCMSLRTMNVAGMQEACYCDECGSTDILEASIEEWDTLYKEKYGFNYLNNNY